MTETEKIKKLCEIIKRQKAEILYWKDMVRWLGAYINASGSEMEQILTRRDNHFRSEGIKEFAERLKQKETTAISCERFEGVVSTDDIDKLVKEMVGEKDDKT